jgi:hypothetical protein
VLAQGIGIGRCPANVNPHVAAVDPTQLLQRLKECPSTGLILGIVRGAGHKQADGPHPVGLLSNCGDRPNNRPAEKSD